jgi:hypothetical protein
LRADVVAGTVDAVVIVEGARVDARGVRVQQGASDLVFIVAAVRVIIGKLSARSVGSWSMGEMQGRRTPEFGSP